MLNYIDSKSIDFGFAMFAIVHKKRLKLENDDGNMFSHEDLVKAVNYMENQISVTRYHQLKELVNKYFLHSMIVGIACDYPNYSEDELIKHIRDFGDTKFYDMYVLNVLHSLETDDDTIKEKIEYFNRSNLDKTAPSFTTVKYLKKHAKEIQNQLIDFLSYFEPVYVEAKRMVRDLVKSSLETYKANIPDAKSFLEWMPVDESILTDRSKIETFVTAMADSAIYIHLIGDGIKIIMGTSLTYMMSDEFKEKQKQQFFKCFSETTKLKILNLIKNEKLCAADLVERLGMSKSNISHHLSQLATSRVIYIADKDGKKAYYDINTSFMAEMFQKTLKEFKE